MLVISSKISRCGILHLLSDPFLQLVSLPHVLVEAFSSRQVPLSRGERSFQLVHVVLQISLYKKDNMVKE